ncbi:MAG: hypothetical protein K0R60_417 [Microbacterium sp.]|jgi:hypothetical protein|nr:hypothetical protein [Microbacterium sp.]
MSADFFLSPTELGRTDLRLAVRARLSPLMHGERLDLGPDEYAYVYGLDDEDGGLMINRPTGTLIWDLVFELQRLGRWIFYFSSGDPIMVVDEEMRRDALAVSPDSRVVIVRSGADILAALGA